MNISVGTGKILYNHDYTVMVVTVRTVQDYIDNLYLVRLNENLSLHKGDGDWAHDSQGSSIGWKYVMCDEFVLDF